MGRKKKSLLEGYTVTTTANDGTEKTVSGEQFTERLEEMSQDMDAKEGGILIISAQLKDEFCDYSYELRVAKTLTSDIIKRKSGSLVHDDLKVAFQKLHAHLAVICEEVDPKAIKDIETIPPFIPELDDFMMLPKAIRELSEKISHFTVAAFKIEGAGENEGVVLTGLKRLSTGEYIKLEAPKITWVSEYPFVQELIVAIDDLKMEVEEYMNGKCKPKLVQQEIGFPIEELTEEEAR